MGIGNWLLAILMIIVTWGAIYYMVYKRIKRLEEESPAFQHNVLRAMYGFTLLGNEHLPVAAVATGNQSAAVPSAASDQVGGLVLSSGDDVPVMGQATAIHAPPAVDAVATEVAAADVEKGVVGAATGA